MKGSRLASVVLPWWAKGGSWQKVTYICWHLLASVGPGLVWSGKVGVG